MSIDRENNYSYQIQRPGADHIHPKNGTSRTPAQRASLANKKKVTTVTSDVLNRHTWYRTEELISFSLFDESLSDEIRNDLAQQIGELNTTEIEIRKPILPVLSKDSKVTDHMLDKYQLYYSHSLTYLKTSCYRVQHEDWRSQTEYSAAKGSLRNMSPLNASCERALALATRVNTHMTRNEKSFQ